MHFQKLGTLDQLRHIELPAPGAIGMPLHPDAILLRHRAGERDRLFDRDRIKRREEPEQDQGATVALYILRCISAYSSGWARQRRSCAFSLRQIFSTQISIGPARSTWQNIGVFGISERQTAPAFITAASDIMGRFLS
jgi:hypothetical protein